MALEITKLRGLGPEELDQEAQSLREEIWKLRLAGARGQLQDPRKVRRARKDLARVMTVMRELELAGTTEGSR